MKYKILKAASEYDLEEQVKEHLLEGWRPLGGVAIVQAEMAFSKVLKFYQAIEKETREDKRAYEDLLLLLEGQRRQR